MVVKQKTTAARKTASTSSKQSDVKSANKPAKIAPKPLKEKSSIVAGWLQDVSLEAPVATNGAMFAKGQREVEFSIGLRRREENGKPYADLRARALVHAGGNVLALAEACYAAEIVADAEEKDVAEALYAALRPSLQGVLALAGHNPPLPETLEASA